jgi:vacuolar-type H+-ATPase subunit I/STV1
MSEALLEEQQEQEVTSNPYNMRKPWHTPDGPRKPKADSLYYEDEDDQPSSKQATRQKAPADEEASNNETNYKKRYDDLKKHYDQKLNEFRQREEQLKAEAKAAQPEYRAPKSEEDLARFKEQYPDLYDTVETVAHMRSQQEIEALRQKMSAIEAREMEIARREAETSLKERHPDFDEIRGDDAFHEWAKEQPDQIQDWIYNNPDNVTLAVKALDLYKLETGKATQKQRGRPRKEPQEQGSAADMVSTKTTSVDAKQPRIWTESEIAKMSLDQFDKYEEEIREAMIEGRVRPG